MILSLPHKRHVAALFRNSAESSFEEVCVSRSQAQVLADSSTSGEQAVYCGSLLEEKRLAAAAICPGCVPLEGSSEVLGGFGQDRHLMKWCLHS